MASIPPPIGRRKTRLRRVVRLIVVLLLVAAAAGLWAWIANRPRTRTPGEELPEITAKLALDLPADAPLPRFSDQTNAAGLGDFRAFAGNRTSQLPEDMGTGVAWGDFDGDGDDDLFLVSAGGSLELPVEELEPSLLYENVGDGGFRRFEGFPETRIRGMAAAWGDYDSDGRLDLVVSSYRSLLLFRNRGDRFELDPSFAAPEGYWAGVAWADFDNDLDLDLYVCGYVDYEVDDASRKRFSEQYGQAVPYTLNPASFEPTANLLFRNRLAEDGAAEFTEEALALGVSNPSGRSLTALWHDFDSDGRLDLYVANDISDNALFLNRPQGFEDAGLAAWVADYRGAMGLTAGDWNRDGDDDLFVTHWVAQENALYDARRLAATEASTGALVFSDLAAPLGLGQIALQSVGWGTEFADLDSDGWLDLFIANGSTFETSETPRRLKPQRPFLMWNQQGRAFHDIAPLAESLSQEWVARGLATSDYDRDGDLDLLVMDLEHGARLLRNELVGDRAKGEGGHEAGHNWLEIRLARRSESNDLPGTAEGATVTVWAGDVPLRRSLTRASYLSQSSSTLHFGLGDLAAVERIEVTWPGGETESHSGVAVNAVWQITRGESTPKRISAVTDFGPAATKHASEDRERLVEFWSKQRAAMDAMKRDNDPERALGLFQEALAINPEHGDSRYYLANLLAARGQTREALAELDTLVEQNPLSHRGYRQRGILLALAAESAEDLAAAEASLERALEINREETGALLALGEVALLRGEKSLADERLTRVLVSNPRAVGALFVRGYISWERGDGAAARGFLEQARAALGPEWKPEGTTAEGDVAIRTHQETSPLSRFWEGWDGEAEPEGAYAALEQALRKRI